MVTYKLVLIRHGESNWNQENRFCGWFDADLSETGESEARRGGQALKGEADPSNVWKQTHCYDCIRASGSGIQMFSTPRTCRNKILIKSYHCCKKKNNSQICKALGLNW